MKKELELYELVMLLKFTATEEDTMRKIEFYRDFLIEKGSQVMVKTHGKVYLAYPIKGLDIATSVQIVYLGNGDLNKQLNTEIQRDESILRTITMKLVDERVKQVFTSAV